MNIEEKWPRVNFFLSDAAKLGIKKMRQAADALSKEGDFDIPIVTWARFVPNNGSESNGLFITLCEREFIDGYKNGIHEVNGIELIFIAHESEIKYFEGKIIDWDKDKLFFLKDKV